MKWSSLLLVFAITFAVREGRADDRDSAGPSERLLVVGSAVFGAGYAPSAVVGYTTAMRCILDACESGRAFALVIPFIGPIALAAAHPADEQGSLSTFQRDVLVASASLQIAGFALVVAGLALRPLPSARHTQKNGSRFVVLPSLTSSSVGVTASLAAW